MPQVPMGERGCGGRETGRGLAEVGADDELGASGRGWNRLERGLCLEWIKLK